MSATAPRTYAPTGSPIAGTPRYRDAPVAAAGRYLDVLGQRAARYYAVDVPDDATAYFGATVSFPRGVGTAWTGATEPDTGSPRTDRCRGGGRYYFALEWAHVADNAPAQLPVELLVGVEPAVVDPGPAPDLEAVEFAAPDGVTVPAIGGARSMSQPPCPVPAGTPIPCSAANSSSTG
ncbi:hypothetical protein AB0M34_16020 [Nocardia sp. NPDC050193]